MSELLTVSPWSFILGEDIQHVVLSVDKNASKFLFAMPGNIYVPLNCQPCGSFNTLTSLKNFPVFHIRDRQIQAFFCLFVSPSKALLLWDFKQIQLRVRRLCVKRINLDPYY